MLKDRIIELAKENLDLANDKEIDFDAKISEMDIDSIDLLDFIMVLEDEYSIEFSEDELDEIDSLSDIISLIESKN